MDILSFNLVCPNGHVTVANREDAVVLAGEDQVMQVENGSRLDAPCISRDDCPDCWEDQAARNRINSLMLARI